MILYWRISAFLPCIDDPKRGFLIKQKVLWICGWILCMVTVRRSALQVTQKEFEGMLIENSDEPYAAEIVASVFGRLKNGKR